VRSAGAHEHITEKKRIGQLFERGFRRQTAAAPAFGELLRKRGPAGIRARIGGFDLERAMIVGRDARADAFRFAQHDGAGESAGLEASGRLQDSLIISFGQYDAVPQSGRALAQRLDERRQ
jgi:hypothetical protein